MKEDANIAYDSFIEKNTGIFESSNTIKGKEFTKNYKALDLSGIIKTINQKRKLYRQYLSPHSDDMID